MAGLGENSVATSMLMEPPTPREYTTRIVPIDASQAGRLPSPIDRLHASDAQIDDHLNECRIEWNVESDHFVRLADAAERLRESNVPVAFPTETVYGLGADATRPDAVGGIFKAKNRPSDNPLIVHVHSLDQLRVLLRPGWKRGGESVDSDPIPSIYIPLIRRFWPGPLSIIVPVPTEGFSDDSNQRGRISRRTTAGLTTFGVRMPATDLSRMLLRLADVPVAAPSANASTRPSPTTAKHVLEDLDGRIEMIVDGGDCAVGLESTIVDGISGSFPTILRPGEIGLDQIRVVPGWQSVVVGYKDKAEGCQSPTTDCTSHNQDSNQAPRAPGMKYKHYSPRARVLLFDRSTGQGRMEVPSIDRIVGLGINPSAGIGVIRTTHWPTSLGWPVIPTPSDPSAQITASVVPSSPSHAEFRLFEIYLGASAADLAHGLFSAFRAFDQQAVGAILVEAIDESDDGVSAAVMNRLRKAAEQV